MAACEKCGAQLAPYTPRCTYCNTVTAFGAAQQAEQVRYQAAAEMQAAQMRDVQARQAQFAANAEVQRSAEQAFNWSLAGLFLCCIPVVPIVGIVMGVRARALAISRGIIVPSKAWMAIALGGTSLVAFGGAIVLSRHIEAEKADRRARVEKELGKHAGDATPSVDNVCKMTELFLLDNEFEGKKLVDGSVSCDAAKWSATGDQGELTGVRVRFYENDPEKRGNVCLEHGQKWVVDTIVSGSCADHWRDKASGSATASASAAPSAAAPPVPADPLAPPSHSARPTIKNGR